MKTVTIRFRSNDGYEVINVTLNQATPALKVSYLRRYYELSDVSMHIYIASELYRTPGVRITSVSQVY